MNRTLRFVLMALVLLSLGFVHITWAVGAQWLVPLAALTLVSPWLTRFQDTVLSRAAWNSGVIVIFVVLVNDATSTGVRYMLEDGLILAAFCQVHLLNNIGRRQKADLLFFNSFLVALVTSFFSQDLIYFAVLLVYTPLLILAMELACVVGHGRADAELRLEPGLLARCARSAIWRGGSVLALTALAFVTIPRDFTREGFVSDHLRFRSGGENEIGFSEEVKLGKAGPTSQSPRVIMRVELLDGTAAAVTQHWRGATFANYVAGEWFVEGRLQSRRFSLEQDKWDESRPGTWRRESSAPVARLRVQVLDRTAARLFAPLCTASVVLNEQLDPTLGAALRDGTLRYARFGGSRASTAQLSYELSVHDPEHDVGGARGPNRRSIIQFVHLAPGSVPDAARHLANKLSRTLPSDTPQHKLVERFRSYLVAHFDYLLPGEPGAATNLDEFLSGQAGGHCEYFATALAIMLRCRRIPCRLVTGFLASEWDNEGKTLTIRSRDAHAWVEVLDPQAGWVVADATPAVSSAQSSSAPGFLAQVRAAVGAVWAGITSFNGRGRAAVLAWLAELPNRAVRATMNRPVRTAIVLLAILMAILLVRRTRQGRVPAAVRRYECAVRTAGLERSNGETPRELLARARQKAIAPAQIDELVAATLAHEAARYCRGALD